MRILGLDLSLRSTGYCMLEEDQVVWHGVIGDENPGVERLAMFDGWIREKVLTDVALGRLGWTGAPRPDYVAIEDYSYGTPQGKTHAFGIGELGGLIKLAVHQARIPLHIIPVNVWKLALCGKGGLKKDLVRLELYKRHGIEFASQDTLEAWAVAMTLRRRLLGLDTPKVPARKSRKNVPAQEAVLDEESPSPARRPTRSPAA